MPSLAPAQVVDPERAAKVKAAYLLNFIRYTAWPDDAFANTGGALIVTEVGVCDTHDVLAELVRRSGPVAGKSIVLRRVLPGGGRNGLNLEPYRDQIASSHLVYVCSLDAQTVHSLIAGLADAHVLTVGDTPDFVENGGMIGFVLDRERILFEANPQAIQPTGVTVSAKVLKLAQIVGTRE